MPNDKLMKASQWKTRGFSSGSEPDNRTIKKWIENGTLAGRVINGTSYVYESEKYGVSSQISSIVAELVRESKVVSKKSFK
ncbi:hypothetical protein [Limnobaculum xujianqingii]|uniref:hypothetical protein n=1 Tax=Limnobaculum xujianqingii TaxID=2738837 RepID=UPI00112AB2D2|nr:hypothetical protein [Limnobaculum xujianqingii]